MNKPLSHGISQRDLDQLHQILQVHCDSIIRVGIFGSRATGRFQATSDIDLVLFGNIDQRTISRIRTECIESNISVSVDIVSYEAITDEALRKHIDEFGQTLYTFS